MRDELMNSERSLANPSLSIIIVNYNGKEFLEGCLTSVLDQTDERCEVILVDNASSDGSVDFVADRFPCVRIISCERNLGFAGGNNMGVEVAYGSRIVLLNNDTRVEPGWLGGLREAIETDGVAVASSLILTEGIPTRYYEKNGSINFLGHNIMRVFDDPTEIFYCSGASLIYRKDLLGIPFDSEYFAYAEDVYLGLRARFLGYNVTHTNNSRVQHFGSGTARKTPSRVVTYYQERNRLLNTLLFFKPETLLKLVPYLVANVVVKFAAAAVARRWSVIGLLRSYTWLLTHPLTIMRKRRALRREKIIDEERVIARMSGKLVDGENMPAQIVNAIALTYCKLVSLKTVEWVS